MFELDDEQWLKIRRRSYQRNWTISAGTIRVAFGAGRVVSRAGAGKGVPGAMGA
jgi:hypothetical protein